MLVVTRPRNDSVIPSTRLRTGSERREEPALSEVERDLGREWQQATFASGVQMLHFVQHDNRAVLPENLGPPLRRSSRVSCLTDRRQMG